MTRVSVHEAKTHLSRLLEEVEKGGEVVIPGRDKPIARLVPIEQRPEPKLPTLSIARWLRRRSPRG